MGSRSEHVNVTVELFGSARLAVGQPEAKIEVPSKSNVEIISRILVGELPDLRGIAVDDAGTLLASHTLSIDGTIFLDGNLIELSNGDRLLLFSSQMGG